MQNYSSVFADTLALFVSPIVPADQGDAGKGQVCVRALYTIHTTMNANVGCISKTGGQTQFYGVAVDAGLDRSDGTGADYLTDVDLGNGTREIRVAYTSYAPPPPGTPLPPTNWVAPTAAMLDYPGPLTLKGGTPPPDPQPDGGTGDDDILLALDEIKGTLADIQSQQAADTSIIMARDDENTEKIQTQIHDLVEDVEESLQDVLVLWLALRPDESRAGKTKGLSAADAAQLVAECRERIHARRMARLEG